MGLKRHIPNALTLANLFLGCVALTRIPSGNLYEVAGLIAGCLALDFMDGLLARWLKAQSELGRQLDSLADLVSFGVVPGIVVFSQTAGCRRISCAEPRFILPKSGNSHRCGSQACAL